MAEGDGLLNRCRPLKVYRGFESLRLRSLKKTERIIVVSERTSDKFLCLLKTFSISVLIALITYLSNPNFPKTGLSHVGDNRVKKDRKIVIRFDLKTAFSSREKTEISNY